MSDDYDYDVRIPGKVFVCYGITPNKTIQHEFSFSASGAKKKMKENYPNAKNIIVEEYILQ